MGDKVITEPLISLSANFFIAHYGDTIFRSQHANPFADMVFFKIYSAPNKFVISDDALKVLNAREARYKFSEKYKESSDIEGAFSEIKKHDTKNDLAEKNIDQVIWGPTNFCRLCTSSGTSFYIPADFQTLRNALILGLNGAHIDIDINEKDLSTTIRTYKPRQAAPKRSFHMK